VTTLRISGVAASYDGRPVLHGLDLAVRSGTTSAILGPSGCGKTTLLRVVAGFQTPHEGTVQLGDEAVMTGHEPGPVVVEADQRRNRAEHPIGTGSPRLCREVIATDNELDRSGAVRGPGRPDHVAGCQPHRRVAGAAEMDGEGPTQVERGVQGQAAAGHLSVQFPMVLGTWRDVRGGVLSRRRNHLTADRKRRI
jgi:ABC-type histidine transport system ATPase subunit